MEDHSTGRCEVCGEVRGRATQTECFACYRVRKRGVIADAVELLWPQLGWRPAGSRRARAERDPFVDGLDLPRALERELVQDDRENLRSWTARIARCSRPSVRLGRTAEC